MSTLVPISGCATNGSSEEEKAKSRQWFQGVESRLGQFKGLSSKDFKKNIEQMQPNDEANILAEVKTLPLFSFQYRQGFGYDPDRYYIGPLTEKSPQQLLVDDGKAISLLDYVTYAIAAIKEQQRIIDNQQSLIQDLQKQMRKLEN